LGGATGGAAGSGPLAPVTGALSTVTSAAGAPALSGATGTVTNSGSGSNLLAPVTSLIGGLLGGTHGK
ncbi:TPA: hypothetical protein QDA76_004540, partial [Burkholderia vietnamiensis]|nr:hypothetical protein [Burkholderia vietnamiensis]